MKRLLCPKIIDPVINGFSPHEVRSNLYICENSIITFGIRGLCLGCSNNTHVEILDRFIKSFVDKVIISVVPAEVLENLQLLGVN